MGVLLGIELLDDKVLGFLGPGVVELLLLVSLGRVGEAHGRE